MPNYYEMLQIDPTASVDAIEQAYEQQYNQWRRLVTHHDPQVVNQANQTLQALETIRTTLTDANRRAAYDAGIGLGGAVAGLADPAALLRSLGSPAPVPLMAPPPSAPSAPAAQPIAIAQSGLWHCVQCGTDNPAQTKFCFKCGNQLVRQCPECGNETSLVATGMCGMCGFSYDVAEHRSQLRGQMANVQRQIANNATQREAELKLAQGGAAIGLGVVILIFGLLCAFIGFTNSAGLALAGLALLGVGVFLLAMANTGNNQHKRKADSLTQSITELEGQQRALQGEIVATKPSNRV